MVAIKAATMHDCHDDGIDDDAHSPANNGTEIDANDTATVDNDGD